MLPVLLRVGAASKECIPVNVGLEGDSGGGNVHVCIRGIAEQNHCLARGNVLDEVLEHGAGGLWGFFCGLRLVGGRFRAIGTGDEWLGGIVSFPAPGGHAGDDGREGKGEDSHVVHPADDGNDVGNGIHGPHDIEDAEGEDGYIARGKHIAGFALAVQLQRGVQLFAYFAFCAVFLEPELGAGFKPGDDFGLVELLEPLGLLNFFNGLRNVFFHKGREGILCRIVHLLPSLPVDEEDGAGGVKNLFICMLYHGFSVRTMGRFAGFCHVILLHGYSGIAEIYRRFPYFFLRRCNLTQRAMSTGGRMINRGGTFDESDMRNTGTKHRMAIPKYMKWNTQASFHESPYSLLIS